MGRVKGKMIKKAAKQLHESVGEFNEDFEHNKKLLKGTMHFKSVRNRVAGGIVKLVKKAKEKEERMKSVVKEEVVKEEVVEEAVQYAE